MTPAEKEKHRYLGDGVYVESREDGIILRTGSHRDYEADDRIVLDSRIIENLIAFIENSEM